MPANPRRARQSWLPELELFTGCSPVSGGISRALHAVDVRAGRVLCRQGEYAEECFVVVDGHADVFVDGARVAGIGRASCRRARPARGARTATATVVAATDMSLLVLSRREFKQLESASPTVLHRVLRGADAAGS